MNYSAILISIFALFFTLFSFWWMNWRRGKLYVSQIKHCSLSCTESKLYVELPIVFFNSGALPVVIESLRLRFNHESNDFDSLHFNAIHQKYESDEGRYFAIPFAIQQREAKQITCEFQRNPSMIKFEAKEYNMKLEAKLMHKKNWKIVKNFKISIPEYKLQSISQFLTTLEHLT